MAERRALTFATLDRVMPDVDVLLEGYTVAGNWSLGQVCNHLATSIRMSVEGYPSRAPWLVRKLVAPRVLRKILRSGRIPDGVKTPEPYVPKPGLDDRAEAEALRATLHLFAANTGPLAEHPFFGRLSPEDWTRLHCIHSAHHLSFVLPAARA